MSFRVVSLTWTICLFVLLGQINLAWSRNLLLLLDSSGSMSTTDPLEFRKMAAQALVALLNPNDLVAIQEYDSESRLLLDWTKAAEYIKIFSAINQVSHKGAFTDFGKALEKSIETIERLQNKAETVVFLLTDGMFEPNLFSDRYAPYNLQFRKALWGKSKAERKGIYKQFVDIIRPVATRIIDEEIIPYFKKKHIQIFTIAFGRNADKAYLRYLAEKTSIRKTEEHTFSVEAPIEMLDAFSILLSYWDYGNILYKEGGDIGLKKCGSIYLDSYLVRAAFIGVLDSEKASFNVSGYKPIPGTHPNLMVIPVNHGIPGTPSYCFSGKGTYRMLLLGKSYFKINVQGLKENYGPQEEINAKVILDFINKISIQEVPNVKIKAIIFQNGVELDHLDFIQKGSTYLLKYVPSKSGEYIIKIVVTGVDKDGQAILPRYGRKYNFTVEPGFFVRPKKLAFGTVDTNTPLKARLKLYSISNRPVEVKTYGEITGTRCMDTPKRLPFINEHRFYISSGKAFEHTVDIKLPRNVCWGDFEGTIHFMTENGYSSKVIYTLHIPSLLEKLTYPILVMLVVLVLFFMTLVSYWVLNPLPKGILLIRDRPSGVITPNSFGLSQFKRGINRFKWDRNTITIGNESTGADVVLRGIPHILNIRFMPFGVYLKNCGHTDVVILRGTLRNTLRRGNSIRLTKGDYILLDGFKLEYK